MKGEKVKAPMKCNSELHLPVRYVPIPGFGGTFVRLLRHAWVWQLGKCKYLQSSDGQFVGRSSLQGKKWDRESKGAGTLFSPHDEVAAKCYKLAQSAFSATGRRGSLFCWWSISSAAAGGVWFSGASLCREGTTDTGAGNRAISIWISTLE